MFTLLKLLHRMRLIHRRRMMGRSAVAGISYYSVAVAVLGLGFIAPVFLPVLIVVSFAIFIFAVVHSLFMLWGDGVLWF